MTSVDCVASCTSAQSSETDTNRVNITDFRAGFIRRQMNYDPEDTFRTVFEKAEFKLRPLTSGELSKLQAIEKKPLVVTVGMRNGKRESVKSNINDDSNGNCFFTNV